MLANSYYLTRLTAEALITECDRALSAMVQLSAVSGGGEAEHGLNECRVLVCNVRDVIAKAICRPGPPTCECEAEFRQALELIRLAKKSLSGA